MVMRIQHNTVSDTIRIGPQWTWQTKQGRKLGVYLKGQPTHY